MCAQQAEPGAARYERVGAAAVIAIGRPHRRNAIDGPTAEAIAQAVRAFNDDADARVLVVTGDEKAFCAGADLKALESLQPRVGKPEGVFGVRRFAPKPVIAAISGWCLGGGLTSRAPEGDERQHGRCGHEDFGDGAGATWRECGTRGIGNHTLAMCGKELYVEIEPKRKRQFEPVA
jgi:hypothetical protein